MSSADASHSHSPTSGCAHDSVIGVGGTCDCGTSDCDAVPAWSRVATRVGLGLLRSKLRLAPRDERQGVIGLPRGSRAGFVSYRLDEFEAHGHAVVMTSGVRRKTAPGGFCAHPVIVMSPSTQGMARESDPSRSCRVGVSFTLLPHLDAVLAYEHPIAVMLVAAGADVIVVDHPRDNESGVQLYCDHDASAAGLFAALDQAIARGFIDASQPVGLWGFSQGGGAVAAALTHRHDLHRHAIRAALVGAPPVHLLRVLNRIDGTDTTGLIGYALAGLAARDDQLKAEALGGLNRRGRRIVAECVNQCALATVLRYGRLNTSRWTVRRLRLEELFGEPEHLRAAFSRLSLDRPDREAPPSDVAIRLWATRFDTLIPFDGVLNLGRVWERAGADVTFLTRGAIRVPGKTALNHFLPYYRHARGDVAWILSALGHPVR